MVRHIDAIFSKGAFQPLEPLTLPEGSRVRLMLEDGTNVRPPAGTKIHTPRLAHREDAADFLMEVREIDDAGV